MDGATRGLAGAVRTLQKKLREIKDLLEECHPYKKQLKQVRADPVLARVGGNEEGDGNGDSKTGDTNPKVRVLRHKKQVTASTTA